MNPVCSFTLTFDGRLRIPWPHCNDHSTDKGFLKTNPARLTCNSPLLAFDTPRSVASRQLESQTKASMQRSVAIRKAKFTGSVVAGDFKGLTSYRILAVIELALDGYSVR